MKLEDKDFGDIRQLAQREMNNGSIQRGEENIFVTKCYVNAFLTFLNMNDYEIVKKPVEDD